MRRRITFACLADDLVTDSNGFAFVDGSVSTGAAGAALVCHGVALAVRLSPPICPLTAELVAILIALVESAADKIVSDSRAALSLVCGATSDDPIAVLCHEIVCFRDVQLFWAKRRSTPELCTSEDCARAMNDSLDFWLMPQIRALFVRRRTTFVRVFGHSRPAISGYII